MTDSTILDIIAAIPGPRYAGFLAAALVLNLMPGSDVMFATASGLSGGPRVGVAAGLGVALGGLWHVGLAAAGVAALMAAHPLAYDSLRWGGAVYLLWLAWQAWGATPGIAEGAPHMTAALWRGFATNALNPKVAAFVLVFLPQFADPALGAVWKQIIVFGGIFTLTGTLVTCAYGGLAGALGRRLTGGRRWLSRVSAAIYVALAARLIWG